MDYACSKRTFNINLEYINLMQAVVPNRKQTEFVNRAIKHELEREQARIERAQAGQMLKKFAAQRKTLAKSQKPSEEVLAAMRAARSAPQAG